MHFSVEDWYSNQRDLTKTKTWKTQLWVYYIFTDLVIRISTGVIIYLYQLKYRQRYVLAGDIVHINCHAKITQKMYSNQRYTRILKNQYSSEIYVENIKKSTLTQATWYTHNKLWLLYRKTGNMVCFFVLELKRTCIATRIVVQPVD